MRVPSIPEIVTYEKDERGALALAEDAIYLSVTRALRFYFSDTYAGGV